MFYHTTTIDDCEMFPPSTSWHVRDSPCIVVRVLGLFVPFTCVLSSWLPYGLGIFTKTYSCLAVGRAYHSFTTSTSMGAWPVDARQGLL